MDLWWTNPVGTSTMMSNNNHCLTTTTTVANNNSSSSNNTNTKTAMPAAIDSEDAATTAPPRKHNGETTNNPVSTAAPPRNRSGETNSVSATAASPRNHNREPNNPVSTTAPLRNHNDETNNPVLTAVPPRNHNVETNTVCGGGGCHSGSARGGSGGGHHRHVRDDGAAASSSAVVTEPQHMAVLSYEQVKRLDGVMDLVVPITGRGNFPDLEVKLKDLVQVVRAKLERDGVKVRDVRLNGGAACHVLAATDNTAQPYNDLDLIFGVDLGTPRHFDKVKAAVLESLLDFLPEGVSKTRISSCSLKEAYVHKMVKVTEGDRWSLISLSNARGKNVELKFVDAMKRQFEFSVDSFHIHLDTLLLFYDCAVDMPLSDSFYPTVVGESVYGDFRESLLHLHRKLIATRNPEEIRGGGLLKYCNLLVRGYTPVNLDEIKTLQRYMCSRFFIDFSDLSQQQQKLYCYLANHFVGEEHLVPQYLSILYQVVDESTVCLMGHERRQTLGLIEEFYYYLQGQQQLQRLGGATSSSKGGGNTVATSSGLLNNCSIHVIYGGGAPQHATGGFYYTPYVTPTLPGGGAHHHHHRQHHYYSCWMPCA